MQTVVDTEFDSKDCRMCLNSHGAQGLVLVYDVTDRSTFLSMQSRLQNLKVIKLLRMYVCSNCRNNSYIAFSALVTIQTVFI